jgi:hypothetical protein
MTLILNAISKKASLQVSDRLLSDRGGNTVDDSNKAFVLVCGNARVTVGYTGLAKAANFHMMKWLISTLSDSISPDYSFFPIIRRFSARATEDFSKLNVDTYHKRVSFIFSGYIYKQNEAISTIVLVSNFEDFDEHVQDKANDKFSMFIPDAKKSTILTIGSDVGIKDSEIEMFSKDINGKMPEAACEIAASFLRKMAEKNSTIGKKCSTIFLPADINESAMSTYHGNVGDNYSISTGVLMGRNRDSGIFFIGDISL